MNTKLIVLAALVGALAANSDFSDISVGDVDTLANKIAGDIDAGLAGATVVAPTTPGQVYTADNPRYTGTVALTDAAIDDLVTQMTVGTAAAPGHGWDNHAIRRALTRRNAANSVEELVANMVAKYTELSGTTPTSSAVASFGRRVARAAKK